MSKSSKRVRHGRKLTCVQTANDNNKNMPIVKAQGHGENASYEIQTTALPYLFQRHVFVFVFIVCGLNAPLISSYCNVACICFVEVGVKYTSCDYIMKTVNKCENQHQRRGKE